MVQICRRDGAWIHSGGRSGARRLAVARFLVVAVAVAVGVTAQTLAGAPVNGLPYAFAHRLGSGIYTVENRTIQIYSLAFSYGIREPSPESRWGMRLTFPVTVGFYDFEIEDILETGLPKHASTVSIVPGLEFPIRVRERWTVTPYGEAGVAHEATEGQATYVYTFGARSLVESPARAGYWLFGTDLFYAGALPEDGDAGGYSELDLGLDRRWPTNVHLGAHEVEFGVFGILYWYWLDPEIVQTAEAPAGAGWQYEFGLTCGTVKPWRVLGIRMPRVGFSYRFGEGAGAVRFVLGKPF